MDTTSQPAAAAAPAPTVYDFTPAPPAEAKPPAPAPAGDPQKPADAPAAAAETPPADAKPEGEEKPGKPRPNQWAELSRRENHVRKAEADLKTWGEVQALKASDPLAALAKLGLTVEQITDAVIAAGEADVAAAAELTPEQRAEKAAEKRIDERLEAERKATEAAQVVQVRQALTAEIDAAAKAAPERFELVTSTEKVFDPGTKEYVTPADLAVQVMEAHFEAVTVAFERQHGRPPSSDEARTAGAWISHERALEAVERHLEQEARKEFERLSKSKKLRPPAPAEGAKPGTEAKQVPARAKTLTNEAAQGGALPNAGGTDDSDFMRVFRARPIFRQ